MKTLRKTLRNLKTDTVIVLSVIAFPLFIIGEILYNKIRDY